MQLVASVLTSIHDYWAAVFILPKSVFSDIDKVLKGFLWCKGELKRGQAKVSWKDICKPKSQGGLGFKPLGPWNEVLIIKNLYNIVSEKNSLWVKWVNVIKLRGRSIWENTSVWYDKWCDVDPLSTIINARNRYDERLGDDLKVVDLIVRDKWNWPRGWEIKFPILKTLQIPMIENGRDDDIKWKDKRGTLSSFSVKAVWEKIAEDSPSFRWNKRALYLRFGNLSTLVLLVITVDDEDHCNSLRVYCVVKGYPQIHKVDCLLKYGGVPT
ncbi:hypothetical protein Tco_0285781 [Tanacetum coccineum]